MQKLINHQALDKAATKKEFVELFVKECRKIVNLVDRGFISLQDGAYAITGLMFYDYVNKNFELEDICIQAADLELPNEMVKDAAKKWAQLKRSIAALAKEGKKDYPRSA